MAGKRLSYLDVARGVAMLAVICGHFGIATANRVVYVFHVPLFLAISGYFLSDRGDVSDFVARRARQLLVPYYLGCVGILVATLFFNTVFPQVYGSYRELIARVAKAALYASGTPFEVPAGWPHIGLLWFLWALFFAQVFVRSTMNRREAPLIIAALYVVGWLSMAYVKLPLSVQPGMMGALFVYAGYLCRKHRLLQSHTLWLDILCGVIFVGAVWTGTYINIVNGEVSAHGLAVFAALAASYFMVRCCQWLTPMGGPLMRALNWYGQLTLPAMVFHAIQDYGFPVWLLSDALATHGMPQPAVHIVIVSLAIGWSVLGCWLALKAPVLGRAFSVRQPAPLNEP